MDISERNLEATIEATLLANGADAVPGHGTFSEPRERYAAFSLAQAGEGVPVLGGYRKRAPEDYDRALCLLPRDVLDFLLATQPKEWAKFQTQHGADAKPKLFQRLAQELTTRGTLDVLRTGIKANGCTFRLAYFLPSSGLNPELQTLHAANVFSIVRQLHYSQRDPNKSLDLTVFLNGLPLFTAELKNPLTGQTVQDAIRQYRADRDPREQLFALWKLTRSSSGELAGRS